MPYFMSFLDKKDEARILFGRILTYYIFGVGSLSLAFFIFAKPVVMIMTQPNFHQAYKVVGLSAGAQFLTGAFSIFLPGIYFAKEVKYVGVVQAVAAALSVVLNLLLIPSLGLLGAGLALMLGMLAMAGLQHAWNFKHRAKYLNVKYEWNRILWFGLLYIACMFLTLFDRSFSLRTEILLSGVVSLVVSIALVTLLSTGERRTLKVVIKELAMRRGRSQSVPISL
jgi:O-antigen/teichoic acid export membrane protein